eukprot:CAMPEP_0171404410 /NCGR_PEP_ID=MMETSP0880-20121228/13713_1 /TAXON_ID=67004 /ORGANISM="Thalassiosira weissflogii, Strain CCMP1336" /LENGTH=214 /DNA_ID=CAMNT_0011919627 /DNA_START=1 /DNA_END=642 /DNA_ORIENTATION=+
MAKTLQSTATTTTARCRHRLTTVFTLTQILLFLFSGLSTHCHATIVPKLHSKILTCKQTSHLKNNNPTSDQVTVISAAQTLRGGASTTTNHNKINNNPFSLKHIQPQQLPKWTHKLLAGGTSRSLAQALLYPIDALRTLAQTRDGRTLSTVGYDALLRGCFQTSSFALVTGALQFGIFEACKDRCYRHFANGGALMASGIAAAGSCLVSVPQEV